MSDVERDVERELDEQGVISEGLAWRLVDALNEAEGQCLDVNVAMKRKIAAALAALPRREYMSNSEHAVYRALTEGTVR